MSRMAKHRCTCFPTEGNSILYGLRREGPSTERVRLERLVNILSRAAVTKSKNPQRIWAKSEEPPWWKECTQLQWKNPREHPKDRKETLKQKINILEKELGTRNLLNSEIAGELSQWKNSKAADLELKSDFEAVISKASSLHYMVNRANSKVKTHRVISEKLAGYISNIKNCLEQSLQVVDKMHAVVVANEKRKTTLWNELGVPHSKRQKSLDEPAITLLSPVEEVSPSLCSNSPSPSASQVFNFPTEVSRVQNMDIQNETPLPAKEDLSESLKVKHARFLRSVSTPYSHNLTPRDAVFLRSSPNFPSARLELGPTQSSPMSVKALTQHLEKADNFRQLLSMSCIDAGARPRGSLQTVVLGQEQVPKETLTVDSSQSHSSLIKRSRDAPSPKFDDLEIDGEGSVPVAEGGSQHIYFKLPGSLRPQSFGGSGSMHSFTKLEAIDRGIIHVTKETKKLSLSSRDQSQSVATVSSTSLEPVAEVSSTTLNYGPQSVSSDVIDIDDIEEIIEVSTTPTMGMYVSKMDDDHLAVSASEGSLPYDELLPSVGNVFIDGLPEKDPAEGTPNSAAKTYIQRSVLPPAAEQKPRPSENTLSKAIGDLVF